LIEAFPCKRRLQQNMHKQVPRKGRIGNRVEIPGGPATVTVLPIAIHWPAKAGKETGVKAASQETCLFRSFFFPRRRGRIQG